MAADGSFTIFYIIDPEGVSGKSGADWVRQPGFVGLTHVLAASKRICTNCKDQNEQQIEVTSTTPITSLLLDYVETRVLESMGKDHVLPFLKRSLKVRVQTVSDQFSLIYFSLTVVKVTGAIIYPTELEKRYKYQVSLSCKNSPISSSLDIDFTRITYDNFKEEVTVQDVTSDQRSMPLRPAK